MSEQLPLIAGPPAEVRLGPRQQLVYDELAERTLTDADAGALVHEAQGRHALERPCDWCAHAGRQMLTSLRRHGLVTRRRSGRWERKDIGMPEARIETPGYDELPEGF